MGVGNLGAASSTTDLGIRVDVIRAFAIIMVIFLHATADLTIPQMNEFEIIRWTTNDVYQSIGRIGIPLFVMLSGALLLQPGKHDTLKTFVKKRWARIGLPWIFWGIAYFIWDFAVLKTPATQDAIVQGILTGPYYNFWYFYMLLGLYFLTPVLRILLPKAKLVTVKGSIVLWFVGVAIIPFAGILTAFELFSNFTTTALWVVYLLVGLAGYFVLGTLLFHMRTNRSVLASLAALGIALTAVSIYLIQSPIGGNLEVYAFTVYFGPWTILAAAALFGLFSTIKTPSKTVAPSRGVKLIKVISQNTLPLALFHVMVLESFQKGYFGFAINGNTINSIVGVPLMTVITLFVSLAIILLLKKIPYLSRLIG
jgi:surface polysaccharide O-acyltransferase-like enzyme